MGDTKETLSKIKEWMDINESRVSAWSFRRPDFNAEICEHKLFIPTILTIAYSHNNYKFIKLWDKKFSADENFCAHHELVERLPSTASTQPTLNYYLYKYRLTVDDKFNLSELNVIASIYPCTNISDTVKFVFSDVGGEVRYQMYASTQSEISPQYISNIRSKVALEPFNLKNTHTKIFYMLNTESAVKDFAFLLLNSRFKPDEVLKFLHSFQSGLFKEQINKHDSTSKLKSLIVSKATGASIKHADIILDLIGNQPFDTYLEAVIHGIRSEPTPEVQMPVFN